MPDFKNVASAIKFLNKQIAETIQEPDSNVSNVVIGELINSIQENVYDAYTSPAKDPYIRQEEHGGLTDPSNFRVEPTKDGIAVSSSREGYDRSGNNLDVMEIIEGYAEYSIQDKWGYGYETPRHAVTPAVAKLKRGHTLTRAVKLDLKNRGIDVE